MQVEFDGTLKRSCDAAGAWVQVDLDPSWIGARWEGCYPDGI